MISRGIRKTTRDEEALESGRQQTYELRGYLTEARRHQESEHEEAIEEIKRIRHLREDRFAEEPDGIS
jgi:hypothetical protein